LTLLIGIDASRALRAQATGTERYAREIVRALLALPEARAHRWRLYVHAAAELSAFLPPGSAEEPPAVELCLLPWRRAWTHTALAREVLRRPPAVLFVPAHVVPLVLPARRLPPAVVTVHDLGYRAFPQAHPLRQRLYLDWSTRWSAHAAACVIAVSEATRRDLARAYGTPEAKLAVVYEAAAPVPPVAQGEIAAAQARYGLARPYALYVGTLQPRKNVVRLLQAYTRLHGLHDSGADSGADPGFDLVLAGAPGWLSAPTLDEAARLGRAGLAGRIHLPGYVPDGDLAALLRGARLFCYPSLYEGFGLPILEAQSAGTPVMTARNSSLPEVAGDAALLVDPEDVDALAAAMLALARDEELRRRLIQAGYENVSRFSWERAARETLSVLEATAKSGQDDKVTKRYL
jgi:glycosyltransferase involved in cell wall biosynthesis